MKKLSAAIIVDHGMIAEWQKQALLHAADVLDVKLVLDCTNTQSKRQIARHFGYYCLNALTIRNPQTKMTKIAAPTAQWLSFDAENDGAWQSMPKGVKNQLVADKIDVVIKFGMSLLRLTDDLKDIPVLSFHHGDPSQFRGRPAGFYELLQNADNCGVIVQRLSNTLDAGTVYAFARSKLAHHSYKYSSLSFYKISKYLLRKAVVNLDRQQVVPIEPTGRNYTLPSNLTVTKFVGVLALRKARRWLYGAFFEKKWQVATSEPKVDFSGSSRLNPKEFDVLPIAKEYAFYADPFFAQDGKTIRLEGLDKATGLGDIVELDGAGARAPKTVLSKAHYSYPFSFTHAGREYLLPEVAAHAAQFYLDLSQDPDQRIPLKGLEHLRIVDGTLFEHGGHFYLFFGENTNAANVLQLYVADSLDGEFRAHPDSPICLDPTAARMGGRVIAKDGAIYRFGQNNCRGYGAAISVQSITSLTPFEYSEKQVGQIAIKGRKGPHTININADHSKLLFDFYEERFALLAGYRRLLPKLARLKFW